MIQRRKTQGGTHDASRSTGCGLAFHEPEVPINVAPYTQEKDS